MPCFHPLPAWRGRRTNPATGRRPVAFRLDDGFVDQPLELPCGRCAGCVQDRANEWALRCEHESKLWFSNYFLTFTYDDAHLPPGGSLCLSHLQDFWKRARHLWPGLRYFACGEYGEQFARPHYHALVFNWKPADLESRTRMDGERVFSSASTVKCWGHGNVQVDAFSPAAAAYVCNYVRKKSGVRPSDYGGRLPEFQVMSRRPGIGGIFARRSFNDFIPDGFVTRRGGARRRIPRFYDLTVEKLGKDTLEFTGSDKIGRMFRASKRNRAAAAAASTENSGSRLLAREKVVLGGLSFFDQVKGRPFEKGSK